MSMQYNSWFGDSEYGEAIEDAVKSRKIAAGKLRLVSACADTALNQNKTTK